MGYKLALRHICNHVHFGPYFAFVIEIYTTMAMTMVQDYILCQAANYPSHSSHLQKDSHSGHGLYIYLHNHAAPLDNVMWLILAVPSVLNEIQERYASTMLDIYRHISIDMKPIAYNSGEQTSVRTFRMMVFFYHTITLAIKQCK